jgi:hypothetical protein
MSSAATKAAVACALAGSAAAFSGLAPAGLKPSSAKLAPRLQLRNTRAAKVLPALSLRSPHVAGRLLMGSCACCLNIRCRRKEFPHILTYRFA